jgi:cyanuric acid amidohydrolase
MVRSFCFVPYLRVGDEGGMRANVIRFPTSEPGDTRSLDSLISSQQIDPRDIVALLCKTEGTGTPSDFSRELASDRYSRFLSQNLSLSPSDLKRRVAFIFSSGCDGVISPHGYIFLTTGRERPALGKSKRLTIGIARTRTLDPEEIGSKKHVLLVAEAVREGLKNAYIEDPQDVHTVFVKSPVLLGVTRGESESRNLEGHAKNRASSAPLTRAASALGVAVAIGEVQEEQIKEEKIGQDSHLYSTVAITFSGTELAHCEVIVLGNSAFAQSDFIIRHGLLTDLLDGEGVKALLRKAGLDFGCCPDEKTREKIAAIFMKVGILPSGQVRGKRTIILESDINFTRHLRAAASGVIASIIGETEVFVSGGAEHQGPPGGGVLSVIVRV